ncbi:hypothetical protein C5F49_02875 [Nitrosopumilus oxyclinae]|uniref:Uncharacterized protein n=1 Tax=Nitrosopumilus oxyclinae TaxID=1959104 RepID=A0A7D5M0Z2_9ARCH|nr:hypothetical protein [Nitrosopumilus oxyclinae]QLH04374.1 hypothetical protein C5F49_02875 [Nitrosopumilus oxyclinae]
MYKFFILIIVMVILVSSAVVVYSGVLLATMIYEDEEFFLPDIPELKTELNEDSNLNEIQVEGIIQSTIRTDKKTYYLDETIHVTGEGNPWVYRIQLTHLNGDNIVNAWIDSRGISYQYDIVLKNYGIVINADPNREYIINAMDADNNVVASTSVFINPLTTSTSKSQSLSSTETTIAIQLEKYAYVENESIHVTGQIINPEFSKQVSIKMYDADSGELIKGFVHNSSSFVSKEGKFEIGFGFNWLNLDGLYMVTVFHNGMNTSKYFTVQSVDETTAPFNSLES